VRTDALYFFDVFDRLSESEELSFLEVSVDEWRPKENDCHPNVDYFTERRPQYQPVRGWLAINDQILNAHSVVCHRSRSQSLYDITPPKPNRERLAMRFIRHRGTEDEFSTLRKRYAQYISTS
jgi:hypothetical protein